MSYQDEIYEVPWNSDRWELAILEQPNIAFLGRRGKWVLYRPARLIVTTRALEDQRVRDALRRGGAERCGDEAAAVAKAIDLELLLAPEERQVELVRRINELVPRAASLDHVQLPGPQRIHGDDDPVPADDPGDIPGTSEAGANMTVLVLDTGYALPPGPTLNVQTDADDVEVADEDNDGLRDPAAGHGTHIAGIIARLAPAATIVARRVLKSPVGQASDLDVVKALLDHGGANIINCSFGELALDSEAPIALQQAIAALPPSTIVVAAAGNAGSEELNWPAAFERVMAVGAVGKPPGDDTWRQTDFSNHGAWVDCCAPGVGIVSTFLDRPAEGFHGFASWTGTSMAAPAIAGSLAALATRPDMTLDKARAQILSGPALGDIGRLFDPATL